MKSPADSVERWTHDLYVEENQGPRTEEEKERVSLLLYEGILYILSCDHHDQDPLLIMIKIPY